jgi:hypothetical protein
MLIVGLENGCLELALQSRRASLGLLYLYMRQELAGVSIVTYIYTVHF